MRGDRRHLALGLVFGIILGTPVAESEVTAAERDGRNGRNGTDGGIETVHDVGNAWEDASCSVSIGNITTGDESGQTVTVDGRSGDPSSIAGSVQGTGVIIIAPAGSSTAGTVGGNSDTDVSVGPCGDSNAGDDTTSTGTG